jgi:hypothetical protein
LKKSSWACGRGICSRHIGASYIVGRSQSNRLHCKCRRTRRSDLVLALCVPKHARSQMDRRLGGFDCCRTRWVWTQTMERKQETWERRVDNDRPRERIPILIK